MYFASFFIGIFVYFLRFFIVHMFFVIMPESITQTSYADTIIDCDFFVFLFLTAYVMSCK